MKRFIITAPVGTLLVLLSAIVCGLDTCAYKTVAVWHGNVTPSGMDTSASEPTVLFIYADHKKGFTTSTSAVTAFAGHGLKYMWCDVARDGSGYCYPPREAEAEAK